MVVTPRSLMALNLAALAVFYVAIHCLSMLPAPSPTRVPTPSVVLRYAPLLGEEPASEAVAVVPARAATGIPGKAPDAVEAPGPEVVDPAPVAAPASEPVATVEPMSSDEAPVPPSSGPFVPESGEDPGERAASGGGRSTIPEEGELPVDGSLAGLVALAMEGEPPEAEPSASGKVEEELVPAGIPSSGGAEEPAEEAVTVAAEPVREEIPVAVPEDHDAVPPATQQAKSAPVEPAKVPGADADADADAGAETTMEVYRAAVRAADAEIDAGRPRAARTRLLEVLALEDVVGEARAYALFLLAKAERRLGEERAAAAHYAEAIDHHPPGTASKNSLAWVLATSRDPVVRDPERAVTLAREALAEAGESAQFLDTLARALLEAGRAQEAVSVQERAVARAPGRTRLAERLAWYREAAAEAAGILAGEP